MRILSIALIVILSFELTAVAQQQQQRGRNQNQPSPAGPTPAPPTVDITVPQQDTRLAVVDFRISDFVEGKEQSAAMTKVSVPLGQTGELSIGNILPGFEGQPDADKQFVGTRIYVTPVLRRDGKIQLACKFRISQLVGQQAAGVAPKIDVREMTTNAVANPGQAVGVSSYKIGDTETRISATPRIMTANAAMKETPPVR